MPNQPGNSFIPKRQPAKQRRSKNSRQVYLFTLLSYIALFAALLAAGGVFLYEQYLDRQLSEQVKALNEEISQYSESEMQEVLNFGSYLSTAKERAYKNVSLVKLLKLLEEETAQTVWFNNLELTRENDAYYKLSAEIETDSFDSTLFQRERYSSSTLIKTATFEEIAYTEVVDDSEEGVVAVPEKKVTFSLTMDVPLESIFYTGLTEVEEQAQAEAKKATSTNKDGV